MLFDTLVIGLGENHAFSHEDPADITERLSLWHKGVYTSHLCIELLTNSDCKIHTTYVCQVRRARRAFRSTFLHNIDNNEPPPILSGSYILASVFWYLLTPTLQLPCASSSFELGAASIRST